MNEIKNIGCIEGLKQLEPKSVDLIITDPPYNIGVNYGKYSNDKKKDYGGWCLKWIKQCEGVLKDRGSFYVIHYPENAADILLLAGRHTKFRLRRWLSWHYPTNIGHSKKNWTKSHRAVLFFTKEQPYKFNLKEGDEILDFLEINLVKNTSKEKVQGFPNQIPEKLVSLLIELSSDEGDLVLDPFAGSGTTLACAKRMKRNYLGFEINPDYVKLINDRLEKVKWKKTN